MRKKGMKILYVSNLDLRKKGGAKTHFIELGQNLAKLGHDLLVLVPGYSPRESQDYGLKIHYIPTFKESVLAYLWAEFIKIFYLIFVIVRFRPEVIYARPVRFDLTPPLLAQLFRIPYVMEKNEILDDTLRVRGFSEFTIKSMRLVERINFRLSDKIVCVTEGIKREIAKRCGVNEDKLVVITNGANIEIFRPLDKWECRRKLGLEEDIFYVGFVGSFAPWQGLETFIEAAKQVKEHGCSEIKYLLVGDGELEPVLRRKVQEYGLEGEVQFMGRVTYEEITYYMNTFDVCYLCKENLTYGFSPLKLYEYLACGRPLIASRVDGVEEVIEEGQCGYLFEVGDVKGIAGRILRAYHERDGLDEFGVKGRQLVLTKYSWQSTANKVIDVLMPLLEKKGRRGER